MPCLEIAKGNTNANATTRATAAKDMVSDKFDEKKHDVCITSTQPRAPTLTLEFQTKSDVYANK